MSHAMRRCKVYVICENRLNQATLKKSGLARSWSKQSELIFALFHQGGGWEQELNGSSQREGKDIFGKLSRTSTT